MKSTRLFFNKIEKYNIILGSQSPRRKQLLELLGIHFRVVIRNSKEQIPAGLKRANAAKFVAAEKMNHYRDLIRPFTIILTADTIVCLKNEILGKPSTEAEAISMLQKLSGQKHEVFTGVNVASPIGEELFAVKSQVWFKKLLREDILFYVKNYKPFDKAGSYGVQDWLGLTAIEKISGSFYNVMGLPAKEVFDSLFRIVQ
ncbi:MAG: Maf family protein [Bacteroidia bacterium]|nr:septum formation protein Maf [Bacteroidia bacterium]MCZ2277116.1 Maf family protein [Bacteroidia bacterium]